jgi:YesN/AraC family two-component response regulator
LSYLKGRLTVSNDRSADTPPYPEYAGKTFCLVAFAVGTPPEHVLQHYHDELEYESIHLFAVDNVFCELMDDMSYDRIEDGHNLLYILYLDAGQAARWQHVKHERMARIAALFADKLSAWLSIVIGDHTASFAQLRQSYCDVLDALEYQSAANETGVLLTADYRQLAVDAQSDRHNRAADLARAVKEGDFGACGPIIRQTFSEYNPRGALSFSAFRMAVIQYLYATLAAFFEMISDHDLRHQLIVKTVRLVAARNVAELQDNLTGFLQYACQTVQAQNKGVNNLLVAQVQAYIEQNYRDGNLNISALADAFSRNPRYLSQLYTQQTGEGLLDCINRVRIRQAEQLMLTGQSLEAIAAQVGYTNIRTFRRAFLRMTGLQPSKFHEAKRRDNGL